ncbi:MAG: imidazole glycerol phosphate synthase subunit HisH [Verrucomicrobiota bacterium]|nr:imidazole glycerol phosphate synthase subunit HisH [Verrucomicrobiota bacterium]
MIALIDYGIGNLRSAEKALLKTGADVLRVTDASQLMSADAAVLPGVGAFGDCMSSLKSHNMTGAVMDFIKSGKPFLGICVGQQMLFEKSFENGEHAGLGVFKGSVQRIVAPTLKVPQIGWNEVHQTNSACPLWQGIPDNSFFYFVHSYSVHPTDATVVAARTDYGSDFPSVIWKDNVFATQFHPEKSQHPGLKLLENFVTLA